MIVNTAGGFYTSFREILDEGPSSCCSYCCEGGGRSMSTPRMFDMDWTFANLSSYLNAFLPPSPRYLLSDRYLCVQCVITSVQPVLYLKEKVVCGTLLCSNTHTCDIFLSFLSPHSHTPPGRVHPPFIKS